MKNVTEQIQEGHQANQMKIAQSLMQDSRMYDELKRFLICTRDDALLRQFYGLDSSRIVPQTVEIILERVKIILPQAPQIYLGNSREKHGFDLENLSHDELSFLIQAFITDRTERDYIVGLVFYENNFLSKTNLDILDYLSTSETLFKQTFSHKNQVLRLIDSTPVINHAQPQAANDNNFTPLVERIETMEPGYFEYLHKSYRERLDFVESIFCQMVASLAEVTENHLWAIDPENHAFTIPTYYHRNKLNLITSICEFHKSLDRDFPMLHELLEGTVRSWILIYKGFSSPADKLRKSNK